MCQAEPKQRASAARKSLIRPVFMLLRLVRRLLMAVAMTKRLRFTLVLGRPTGNCDGVLRERGIPCGGRTNVPHDHTGAIGNLHTESGGAGGHAESAGAGGRDSATGGGGGIAGYDDTVSSCGSTGDPSDGGGGVGGVETTCGTCSDGPDRYCVS